MTFTYALDSADQDKQNIARVRLEIGDTVPNAGVKPDNSNFADEELAIWLSDESDDITRAVGRACDVLSRLWTNVANLTVGPRKEDLGTIAAGWEKRARQALPLSAGDTNNYSVNVISVDHTENPYRYRLEEENQ